MKLDSWLNENHERLIDLRRYLHQYPEVGFKEFNTSKHLREILADAGYKIQQTEQMKTGFVCDIGDRKGPTLGIRCDMDALAMCDAKNVPYASKNAGSMHACGHDVHMSIVTGMALWMKENEKSIPGTIRFIFQPAEEQAPGGAQAMMESGIIDNIDHIIGLHMLPRLDAGKIATKTGAMSAAVELIDITIRGEGGHTSRPHETTDLISVMAHIIIALDEALSREVDHLSPVVLSFGKVSGGNTFNVIPNKVNLQGTLRYLDSDLRDRLHQIINDVIVSIGGMFRAEISYQFPYFAPAIENDTFLTNIIFESVRSSLGEDALVILDQASMGGEDFAFYLEKIPGTYFRVGCGDGVTKDVHTVHFDVDEDCIGISIKVLDEAVNRYFQLKSSNDD